MLHFSTKKFIFLSHSLLIIPGQASSQTSYSPAVLVLTIKYIPATIFKAFLKGNKAIISNACIYTSADFKCTVFEVFSLFSFVFPISKYFPIPNHISLHPYSSIILQDNFSFIFLYLSKRFCPFSTSKLYVRKVPALKSKDSEIRAKNSQNEIQGYLVLG